MEYATHMRILVVEDSVRLRTAIAKGLTAEGYAVDTACDGQQGLVHAQTSDYDVIVLDIMMPKLSGLEMLTEIRNRGINTPVLILSARDTVDDRVLGLRTGADDYLLKPFSFEELLARIEALARRLHDAMSPIIKIGELQIDMAAKRARVQDHPLDLPRREYALLEYLALRAGAVVTRAELEEHIYNGESQPWSNAIDSAVSAVRKKLKAEGIEKIIHTRRGIGYTIEPDAPAHPSSAGGPR